MKILLGLLLSLSASTLAFPSSLVEPKCALVDCAKPLCANGKEPVVHSGQCCPKCEPDCSLVLCALPNCPKGQIAVTPPGKCCPECQQPDCSSVRCASPNCGPFEKIVFPPGECCPRCELDCSTVLCLLPDCSAGEVAVVPEGQCCPQCQCPHNCTAEFCKENPTAICSKTGPREIPGCTGSCNLSYCNACFHHAPYLPPSPSSCGGCDSYTSDTQCFRKWARCIRKHHISKFGDEVNEKLDFLCYSPFCPLRG